MTTEKKLEQIEYWKKRVKFYRRKYGKNSIELESALLNLQRVASLYDSFTNNQEGGQP